MVLPIKRRRLSLPYLLLSLAGAVLVLGIGLKVAQSRNEGVPVDAVVVRPQPFAVTVTASGVADAVDAIDVRSEISGRVLTV